MKQGKARHFLDAKTEPVNHAIDPCAVAAIGISQGNHAADGGHTTRYRSEPLYEGRGLKAPMKSVTQHHNGSQGKH